MANCFVDHDGHCFSLSVDAEGKPLVLYHRVFTAVPHLLDVVISFLSQPAGLDMTIYPRFAHDANDLFEALAGTA